MAAVLRRPELSATRLAALSLAAFRLTRLVTRDDFPPILTTRNWIINARHDVVRRDEHRRENYRDHWWAGELVTCPWCASAYIAAALVGWDWRRNRTGDPLVSWLAVWGSAAALHKWTDG